MKSISKKNDETMENNQKDASQIITDLKNQVGDLVKQLATKSASPSAVSSASPPTAAPAVVVTAPIALKDLAIDDFVKKFDEADKTLQKNSDSARKKIKLDSRGLL